MTSLGTVPAKRSVADSPLSHYAKENQARPVNRRRVSPGKQASVPKPVRVLMLSKHVETDSNGWVRRCEPNGDGSGDGNGTSGGGMQCFLVDANHCVTAASATAATSPSSPQSLAPMVTEEASAGVPSEPLSSSNGLTSLLLAAAMASPLRTPKGRSGKASTGRSANTKPKARAARAKPDGGPTNVSPTVRRSLRLVASTHSRASPPRDASCAASTAGAPSTQLQPTPLSARAPMRRGTFSVTVCGADDLRLTHWAAIRSGSAIFTSCTGRRVVRGPRDATAVNPSGTATGSGSDGAVAPMSLVNDSIVEMLQASETRAMMASRRQRFSRRNSDGSGQQQANGGRSRRRRKRNAVPKPIYHYQTVQGTSSWLRCFAPRQ